VKEGKRRRRIMVSIRAPIWGQSISIVLLFMLLLLLLLVVVVVVVVVVVMAVVKCEYG